MTDSNNYFQLVSKLKQELDWLNQILIGGEADSVVINGIIKPSISKDIADKWEAISTLANGRDIYETRAQMDASGAPSEGKLAEVWNDPTPENNGIYGWDGSKWQLSSYDRYLALKADYERFQAEIKNGIVDLGVRATSDFVKDAEGNPVAFAITDEKGHAVVLVRNDSSLEFAGIQTLLTDKGADKIVYAIQDENGQTPFSLDEEGNVTIGTVLHEVMESGKLKWGVTDEVGRLALGVNDKGHVETGSSEFVENIHSFAWGICDSEGRLAIGIRHDGKVEIPFLVNGRKDKPEPESKLKSRANFPTDYMQLFTYGQSLSRGSTSIPPVSTVQPYNNVTFAGGVHSRGGDNPDLSSFIPLVENTVGHEGETPTSGTLNHYVELLEREGISHTDHSAQWIGTAPGRGGEPIVALNKGTLYWTGMIEQVQAANDIAQAEGRSHSVQAMTWTQGCADYSRNTSKTAYKELLTQMKEDFAEDVSAITGQDFKPPIIHYQLAAHRRYNREEPTIALAFLELSNEDPDFYLACAMYNMEYNTDNLHLTPEGSRTLGYYYGRALKAILVDKADWKPLQPTNVFWQGKVIDIQFHVPHGELTIDTDWVAAAPNYGFDIWDNDGVLTDIISSVNVVAKDRVRLILSRAVLPNERLTYAKGRPGDPAHANRMTGPRGNLRDTHGMVSHYTGSDGSERYLHNWCVIFESINQ
ncbi:sialate O-acetylesterase [Vibrio alginolyticus]